MTQTGDVSHQPKFSSPSSLPASSGPEDLAFQNTALGRVDPRPCTFVPEISLQYILYLLFLTGFFSAFSSPSPPLINPLILRC